MKLIYLSIIAISLAIPSILVAQGIPCPIPCWKESFPYYFCDITGARHLKCASNPWSDTSLIPRLTPSMSKLPGCVNVIPIDSSLDYQPTGPVPDPPTQDFIACIRDADPGSDYNPDDGWSSEDAWQVAYWQWQSDSSYISTGEAPEPLDGDTLSFEEDSTAELWYTHDSSWFVDCVVPLIIDYDKRVSAHDSGTDVTYDPVWSNTQANSDAQAGLNAWLAICNLKGDPSCCILVKPSDSITSWPGNYVSSPGHAINFGVGYTYGDGSYCAPSLGCPPSNQRYIIYNTTNKFLYRDNDNSFSPNLNYILHPSAPILGWFTGPKSPNSIGAIDPGYSDVSFQYVVEHEIGHFLGMNHPTQITDDGTECINNQSQCADSLDTPMLMSTTLFINNSPTGLQHDDSCMFAKLYCTNNPILGVFEELESPDWFNPQIFPNPSNGGMTLTFNVQDRSFVQIGIYDLLGTEIREVSSDYDEQGPQSLSLGTETLPSGNYVCRVRVGDRVSYINLAIVK